MEEDPEGDVVDDRTVSEHSHADSPIARFRQPLRIQSGYEAHEISLELIDAADKSFYSMSTIEEVREWISHKEQWVDRVSEKTA